MSKTEKIPEAYVGTTMFMIREILGTKNIVIKDVSEKVSIRSCRTLLSIFESAEDTRMKGKIVYKLNEIILMAFLAAFAGADNNAETVTFWAKHLKLYKKIFKKVQIPSHDTFGRVLGIVKTTEMNGLVADILLTADKNLRKALNLPAVKARHLSVDGKELNGTGRINTSKGEIRNLQTLNIYDNTTDTCLVTMPIEDKTNEIPVARDCLSNMCLKDTVVTADAIHAQKKTVETIRKSRGNYVLGLKGNQPKLEAFAQGVFTEKKQKDLQDKGLYIKKEDVARNKVEIREYFIHYLTSSQKKNEFDGWLDTKSVVFYKRTTIDKLTSVVVTHANYYITDMKDLMEIAVAIREHWGVENRLHNGLDTVLNEDSMSTSNRNAAANRSIINKMCLALIRKIQDLKGLKGKMGKVTIRKSIGWDFEGGLREMLALMDPLTIQKVIVLEEKAS